MPTNQELDTFANDHIGYEVRMLVGQVKALERLGRSPATPAEQAYLEASLVHIRLLDEFLGGRPKRTTDVRADDWGTSWPRSGAPLTKAERKRVDAHLAHLPLRRVRARDDWQPAEVGVIARTCLTQLLAFIGTLSGQRAAAFDVARREAAKL